MALTSIDIKIENICRTCLTKEAELFSVFNTFVGASTLKNIITSVTGIEFTEGDGLPTTVCSECKAKAETAYDFMSRSRESDMALQGLIKKEKLNDNHDVESGVNVKIENIAENGEMYMDLGFNISLSNSNDNFDDDEIKSLDEPHTGLQLDHQKLLIERSAPSTRSKKKIDTGQNMYDAEHKVAYCPVCDTSYADVETLTKHMWHEHSDVMGPKKRGRPKKVQTSAILKKLSENGMSLSTCEFCKMDYKTKEKLDLHMHIHKDTLLTNCLVCKKVYLSKAYYQQHKCQRNHIDKLQNAEPPDPNIIQDRSAQVLLAEIVKSSDAEEAIECVKVCEACGRVCRSPAELQQHRDADHPELSASCQLCDKKFASVKTAERHRVTCERVERKFVCNTCGRRFAFEISLNKHILQSHAGQRVSVDFISRQKRQVSCDLCGKTFPSKEQLVRHSIVHKTTKKYECDKCKKKFTRKGNLKSHIHRVHESGRSSKGSGLCLYCGRSFNNSSNLIVHMRRHTGEKPYQCDFCGKGFPRSSDLQYHRRSHTGEKPCKCGICGKGFTGSNKLSRHMRVHTGARPYKCPYCDKAFSQSNDLTVHVRRHTGDKPYACDVCGDRFIQGTALHNHRRVHGHYPGTQCVTFTVQTVTQTH
ncbi:zinc finger protein 345-like isoform X2 [Aricia agestis]|uniref:zinc finger protein 345-like isoform X2 n=1 Tax=Aricia agestis TaxID=91739 RepID=UPI001C206AA9|nr:zinc finger protein 345-like isoform X2 [Aricia agestis]